MTTKRELRRQTWMAEAERLVIEQRPDLRGRVDWDSLRHCFNIGDTPDQAADRLARNMAAARTWGDQHEGAKIS